MRRTHRLLPIGALAMLLACAAHAQESVPLPQPRPLGSNADVPLPMPRPTMPTEIPLPAPRPEMPRAEATAGPPTPSACMLRLTSDIAEIKALPPIEGADGCGITDPVMLSAVITKDKAKLAISPPVTLGCAMAEAVAKWLREDVVTIANDFELPLAGLASGQGYQCRGRNGVLGAPVSQHGRGNALDIRAILLANGKRLDPTDLGIAKELRERIKLGTCAHFTSVLGPGSDGHHEDHIHLDVAERRGGHRLCQWEVRDGPAEQAVPLPRERPAEAPPRKS